MTLTEYKYYHNYEIWRTDIEDEDECVEYVRKIWEDDRLIDENIDMLNRNSNKYQYYYKLA